MGDHKHEPRCRHCLIYLPLTKRELEILHGIVSGLTWEEIAERSTTQANTVRVQRAKIYKKLGVHSSTQAALLALRLGIVKVSDIGYKSDHETSMCVGA